MGIYGTYFLGELSRRFRWRGSNARTVTGSQRAQAASDSTSNWSIRRSSMSLTRDTIRRWLRGSVNSHQASNQPKSLFSENLVHELCPKSRRYIFYKPSEKSIEFSSNIRAVSIRFAWKRQHSGSKVSGFDLTNQDPGHRICPIGCRPDPSWID